MDVWSKTFFPANIGLYLLVTTISRQVDQLNFPLSPLDTALGMSSEVIQLRRADGTVRYTGWFRKLAEHDRVLYTGFYMTERVPGEDVPCVKVVFPMPNGNATVILRPRARARRLVHPRLERARASGARASIACRPEAPIACACGGSGRCASTSACYVDAKGALRCDHSVKFLGLPVLRLHYKMARRASVAAAS